MCCVWNHAEPFQSSPSGQTEEKVLAAWWYLGLRTKKWVLAIGSISVCTWPQGGMGICLKASQHTKILSLKKHWEMFKGSFFGGALPKLQSWTPKDFEKSSVRHEDPAHIIPIKVNSLNRITNTHKTRDRGPLKMHTSLRKQTEWRKAVLAIARSNSSEYHKIAIHIILGLNTRLNISYWH